MSTNAAGAGTVSPGLMHQLAVHLQQMRSELTSGEAAAEAIVAWIAGTLRRPEGLPQPGRGYLWKTLFLPDTTELRMGLGASTHHARVVGDCIIFQGREVSPRGLTLAIAGEGRNAWRDLWLKLPGERFWKNANRCRLDIERAQKVAPVDPAQHLQAAAAAMSEALKSALALAELSRGAAGTQQERRIPKSRRTADSLGDDCAF